MNQITIRRAFLGFLAILCLLWSGFALANPTCIQLQQQKQGISRQIGTHSYQIFLMSYELDELRRQSERTKRILPRKARQIEQSRRRLASLRFKLRRLGRASGHLKMQKIDLQISINQTARFLDEAQAAIDEAKLRLRTQRMRWQAAFVRRMRLRRMRLALERKQRSFVRQIRRHGCIASARAVSVATSE